LKLEILNKAVNNLDRDTEMTKNKVQSQNDEKDKLIGLISNEQSKLEALYQKARDLSEKMERLKKGNMMDISNEIDHISKEVKKKNEEIELLEAELNSAQKH